MDFHVERIMIDNDDIDVYVHWQGLWKKDPEDPGIRHRGHSRLQWVGTKSVLLSGIQGDIPFGVNRRQALTSQSPRATARSSCHAGQSLVFHLRPQPIFSSSAAESPVCAQRSN